MAKQSLTEADIENDLKTTKTLLESLKRDQTIFTNAFPTLTARQRADMLRVIQGDQKKINAFIDKTRRVQVTTSSVRFSIENLKQGYQTALQLWKRTEKLLETFQGHISTTKPSGSLSSPTDGAVADYVTALQKMGHQATPDMVSEFKNRLDSAYEKAKIKTGGRDLNVQIVQEGGKIKVRMEPK